MTERRRPGRRSVLLLALLLLAGVGVLLWLGLVPGPGGADADADGDGAHGAPASPGEGDAETSRAGHGSARRGSPGSPERSRRRAASPEPTPAGASAGESASGEDGARDAGPAAPDARPLGDEVARELVPPEGAERSGLYGICVALADGVAVVGDPRARGVGAADVYERRDGVWTHAARLVPEDGADGDEFGRWVAAGGGRVYVSGRRAARSGRNSGAIHRYERREATWVLAQTLGSPHPEGRAWKGFAGPMDADGDVVLAGNDACATAVNFDARSAQAHVCGPTSAGPFALSWVLHLAAAERGEPPRRLGAAVALAPPWVVVSAPASAFSKDPGRVHVWRLGVPAAAPETLAPPGALVAGAVAASAGRVAAVVREDGGARLTVAVWTRDESARAWRGPVAVPTPEAMREHEPRGDAWPVSLDGDVVLLGLCERPKAPYGASPRQVLRFRERDGTWTAAPPLRDPAPETPSHFGVALDAAGGTAIVGDPVAGAGGGWSRSPPGRAWIFER